MIRLCLVGGHLTPAVAVARLAKRSAASLNLIGSLNQTSSGPSREADIISSMGIDFFGLNPPKFVRHQPLTWLGLPSTLIKNVLISRRQLKLFQPHVVCAFGGYVSVPVGLAAWSLGLPLVLHEQTAVIGLANLCLLPFARKIYLGQAGAARGYFRRRQQLLGNPLRQEFFQPAVRPPWLKSSPKPLIYVTGGGQGSVIINRVISQLYPQLLSQYRLVHQCGAHIDKPAAAASVLPPAAKSRLYLRQFLTAAEVAYCLKHAHVVISRAGANTVNEIIYCLAPAIFIPLPHARFDEQRRNLESLIQNQACVLLPQSQLTPDRLLSSLHQAGTNAKKIRGHLARLKAAQPVNSAEQLFDYLKSYAPAAT